MINTQVTNHGHLPVRDHVIHGWRGYGVGLRDGTDDGRFGPDSPSSKHRQAVLLGSRGIPAEGQVIVSECPDRGDCFYAETGSLRIDPKSPPVNRSILTHSSVREESEFAIRSQRHLALLSDENKVLINNSPPLTCGLYAYDTPESILNSLFLPPVIARMSVYGVVVPFENGFRSSHMSHDMLWYLSSSTYKIHNYKVRRFIAKDMKLLQKTYSCPVKELSFPDNNENLKVTDLYDWGINKLLTDSAEYHG